MNADQRLHGLIENLPALDWNSSAGLPVAGGVDRTMNRPQARRDQHRPTRRLSHTLQGRIAMQRTQENHPFDPDIREELVSRVRQEIQAGTYDTLERFEAALDRFTDRYDRD